MTLFKKPTSINIISVLLIISLLLYKKLYYVEDLTNLSVVSLSSDGQYAITSGADKRITLWNLKNRKAKIISTDANIYSAYFIKNTHNFIWQDLKENKVYVQDVNENIIKTFRPGFLGRDPFPSLEYYSQNASVDTSIDAHIVVTGQYSDNGIILYQYDPKLQILERKWSSKTPSFLARWFWVPV